MIIIAYLMKYKSTYRLKCDIDLSTNDFPRDDKGILDTDDIYIKCANNCRIYHYGKSILVAYIPSLIRGHNILKRMYIDEFGLSKEISVSLEESIKNLKESGLILSYMENDSEVEFKFYAKNIETIAKYLKPVTSGAGISPFSTRNLPKSNYQIPEADLKRYKEVVEKKFGEDYLSVHHKTKEYLKKLTTKKNPLENIKKDMKMKCMKPKEYIHYIGKFEEYLKFLED